jgi:hypothetical protein
MSDPFRNDNDLDLNRSYRRNDDSAMWAGILVAGLVLMAAVFFVARDRPQTAANNNAPGTSTTRPIDKPMSGNPSGTNTPNTTGSAPAR